MWRSSFLVQNKNYSLTARHHNLFSSLFRSRMANHVRIWDDKKQQFKFFILPSAFKFKYLIKDTFFFSLKKLTEREMETKLFVYTIKIADSTRTLVVSVSAEFLTYLRTTMNKGRTILHQVDDTASEIQLLIKYLTMGFGFSQGLLLGIKDLKDEKKGISSVMAELISELFSSKPLKQSTEPQTSSSEKPETSKESLIAYTHVTTTKKTFFGGITTTHVAFPTKVLSINELGSSKSAVFDERAASEEQVISDGRRASEEQVISDGRRASEERVVSDGQGASEERVSPTSAETLSSTSTSVETLESAAEDNDTTVEYYHTAALIIISVFFEFEYNYQQMKQFIVEWTNKIKDGSLPDIDFDALKDMLSIFSRDKAQENEIEKLETISDMTQSVDLSSELAEEVLLEGNKVLPSRALQSFDCVDSSRLNEELFTADSLSPISEIFDSGATDLLTYQTDALNALFSFDIPVNVSTLFGNELDCLLFFMQVCSNPEFVEIVKTEFSVVSSLSDVLEVSDDGVDVIGVNISDLVDVVGDSLVSEDVDG